MMINKLSVKEAINFYYLSNIANIATSHLPEFKDFYNNVSRDIASGLFDFAKPIKRRCKTDTSVFKQEFGFDLPQDIEDYINIYWHGFLIGAYTEPKDSVLSSDDAVLFPIVKLSGETEKDVLYRKYDGFMWRAKYWSENADITKYIPVGYTLYYDYHILYEVSSGKIFTEDEDVDFQPSKQPVADSLAEFITKIKVGGSYEISGISVKDIKTDQYLYAKYMIDLNDEN